VRFTPAAAATYQGTLEITTDEPGLGGSVTYNLLGEGIEACVPQTPDPGEPTNDDCASAIDRGAMSLGINSTETTSWSDALIDAASDEDFSKVTLTAELGCTLVGFEVTAQVTLPQGEQAEVCVILGDCTTGERGCSNISGTGQARLTVFPADSVCDAFNNLVPAIVHVRHTSGEPSCQPYTVNFTAR
jgi:hypothetical protein